MVNYEPGQDRNVAALSILVMCDGFNFYERFEETFYETRFERSEKSGSD